LIATPLWDRLQAEIEAWKPLLIVLDSRADLYGGDEIVRRQVRTFVSALRRIGQMHDAAALLLSHPSLAGLNSGSGLSGSTAWNNSVRSRLYLSKPKPESDEDGVGYDPDLRFLSLQKANYAPECADLRLHLRDGVFVADGESESAGLPREAAELRVEQMFLDLLAKYTAEGRNVSAAPGPNYAPAIFAKDVRACSVSKQGFALAMNRLFAKAAVKIIEEGSPSRRRKRLVAVTNI
jgi:RecA-family ATPase